MNSPTAESTSSTEFALLQEYSSPTAGSTVNTQLSDFLGDDLNDINPVTFDSRRKKSPKRQQESPGQHEVKFSVTIAMSVSNPGAFTGGQPREMTEHRRSTIESTKPHTYFHIEYQLFPVTPTAPEKEVVKTDVVYYGYAAKVFPDRLDAKYMKTWNQHDETWFAWVQNFVMIVNTELLSELTSYKMIVRVWDTKEKCSTRARFDRPKSFRFAAPKPGQDPESVDGVKPCVLSLSRAFEKDPVTQAMLGKIKPLPHQSILRSVLKNAQSGRPFSSKSDRSRPNSVGTNASRPHSITKNDGADGEQSTEGECELYTVYNTAVTNSMYLQSAKYTQLERLASTHVSDSTSLKPSPRATYGQKTNILTKASSSTFAGLNGRLQGEKTLLPLDEDASSSTDMKLESRRLQRLEAQEREAYTQNGRFTFELNLAALFVGRSVLERIPESDGAVEDMFVQVSVSEDLLSRQQAEDLNPMVIRIKGASNMPENPDSYAHLRNTCKPAYCQYRFFQQPLHLTLGRPQDNHIVWNDIQVVLTGLMDKVGLFECLAGSQLTIEVHDRDLLPKKNDLTPALFGTEMDDDKISSVTVITGTKPQQMPPKTGALENEEDKRASAGMGWNPYGIAKVDFQELILGQRSFHSSIPITPCPMPSAFEILGDGKEPNNSNNPNNTTSDNRALPMGNYMDNQASLKISLEMMFPLKPLNESPEVSTFGRLVIFYSSTENSITQMLLSLMRSINAAALGISSEAEHVITNQLKEISMSLAQSKDYSFNAISGFHLDDGENCVAVLEAPKELAIETVWVTLSAKRVWSKVRVLYDKNCGFSRRQYPNLSFQVPFLNFHDKLKSILKQPLLYVRDVLPSECFIALTKLGQLLECSSMKNAVKNDLFPTENMVVMLEKEFCKPKPSSFESTNESGNSNKTFPSSNKGGNDSWKTPRIQGMARYTKQIDNYNEAFIATQQNKRFESLTKDFLRQNTALVQSQSKQNEERRIKSCPLIQRISAESQPVHNYSIQRLNSTELARGIVRSKLLKGRSYTYCQQYQLSAEFSPVDQKELRDLMELQKKQKRISLNDWIYPGVADSLTSNKPPVFLTDSRKEELLQPWKENSLHTSFLYPTLPERGVVLHDSNKSPMRLCIRPQEFFGEEPVSIMPAGDFKESEEEVVKRLEENMWKERVIVSNVVPRIHRLLPHTENCPSGPKSSNQIDRLRGIRKDPSRKGDRLLRLMNSEDLPSLSVLNKSYRDKMTGHPGLMPGEEPGKSLLRSYIQRSSTMPAIVTK